MVHLPFSADNQRYHVRPDPARNFVHYLANKPLAIGNIYYLQGNVLAAEQRYEEANGIAQYADPEIKREIITQLAASYEEAGKFDQALELYEQGLQMSRENGSLGQIPY